MKRLLNVGIVVFAAGMLMLFSPIAHADNNNDHNGKTSNSQPKLYNVMGVTSNSVDLSFRNKKFDDQPATVIVSVKNKSTGILVEKAYKTTLDEDGIGSVKVTGLKPGTKYEFKVRLMKVGSEKSTKNSKNRSATTT